MRDPPWWKNCFFPYKFNPPGNWNKNELLCILLCIYIKSSLKWRKVIRHHLHFSHYFSESSHDKTELSRTELNRQGRSAADNGREGGHHSIWAQLNVCVWGTTWSVLKGWGAGPVVRDLLCWLDWLRGRSSKAAFESPRPRPLRELGRALPQGRPHVPLRSHEERCASPKARAPGPWRKIILGGNAETKF